MISSFLLYKIGLNTQAQGTYDTLEEAEGDSGEPSRYGVGG